MGELTRAVDRELRGYAVLPKYEQALSETTEPVALREAASPLPPSRVGGSSRPVSQPRGSDDPENGVCVCRPCHLRLIHTRRVSLTREGERLIWTYPQRRVVVT